MYESELTYVTTTLFSQMSKSIVDDYLNCKSNLHDSLIICKQPNHEVILTRYCAIIRKIANDYLKYYLPAVKTIIDEILCQNNCRGLRYEASTVEYIKNIEDVEKYFNGIFIEKALSEEYNIKRDENKQYSPKETLMESYSTQNDVEYFNETKICYKKNISFSTGEYYDDRIGRVSTKICTYQNGYETKYSKEDIVPLIEELKEKQFEILLKSFKDEYIEKICNWKA